VNARLPVSPDKLSPGAFAKALGVVRKQEIAVETLSRPLETLSRAVDTLSGALETHFRGIETRFFCPEERFRHAVDQAEGFSLCFKHAGDCFKEDSRLSKNFLG